MQSETREMDAFDVQLSEIEVKSLDNGDLQVEGYASTFHDRDRHNDTIDPAAFDETMPRFMEKPVMLAFHQPKLPMGFFPEATLDSKGLYVKGKVAKVDDEERRSIRYQIESGQLHHFSIGGVFHRKMKDGHPHIVKVDLKEISVVGNPANPHAAFSVQRGQKSWDGMEFGLPVKFETKSLEPQTMPEVSVMVEGAGTDDFLGYYFGVKGSGHSFYPFKFTPRDPQDLDHRLKRLEEYAWRAGVGVTVHVEE